MSKKYIVSCDTATEDPIMYTFVYEDVRPYWRKNSLRKRKIKKIFTLYSAVNVTYEKD